MLDATLETEAHCVQTSNQDWPALDRNEELLFPLNKRVVTQYTQGDSGELELHLHHRGIEVVFDEPDLFVFGETLAKQTRFVAQSALAWGDGYPWPRVKELLEQLLQAGVLRRASASDARAPAPAGKVCSPLPAAECSQPRTWRECEALTQELTGRSVEFGYLELFVPLYRTVHTALDREGRQVGEANVFPNTLRLDIATEWRTCQYPGSRFQDEFPLNVSALRSMVGHFPALLRLVAELRQHYLARFAGEQEQIGMSVGDIYCLSMLSMGVAGYAMLNERASVDNGELHPVLSSLVRISDGVRITADELLFSRYEGLPMPPNAALCARELYAFAERNDLLLSRYGVCAAPKAMIDSYLDTLFDVHELPDSELDDDLQRVLAELGPAFDYGLYALRAYAVVFSTWAFIGETHQRLREILAAAQLPSTGATLKDRLNTEWQRMVAAELATPEQRARRLLIYGDLYARSGRALTGAPTRDDTLAACTTPGGEPTQPLAAALERRLTDAGFETTTARALAATLAEHLAREQAHVRAAERLQAAVNRTLGRAAPRQPLSAAVLLLHHQLRRPDTRLPRCIDAFEDALSIELGITSQKIELRARDAH